MRTFRNLSLTIAIFSLFTSVAICQKRKPAAPPRSQAVRAEDDTAPTLQDGDSIQTTICKGQPTPSGYVTAGETSTSDCPNGAWILKRRGTRLRSDAPPANSAPAKAHATANDGNDEDDEDDEESPRRRRVSVHAQESSPEPKGPSRADIETAIRQQKVIIGMEMQDVFRAWGRPYEKSVGVSERGSTATWYFQRGRVWFINGKVTEAILLR